MSAELEGVELEAKEEEVREEEMKEVEDTKESWENDNVVCFEPFLPGFGVSKFLAFRICEFGLVVEWIFE